jgi:hypothetical protein
MAFRLVLFVSLATVLGCGTSETEDPSDSGTDPGDDAFVDPGVDAWMASGDDAGDGMDPLNAAPVCTSGRTWRFGNIGNQAMNPGLACIACHDTEPRAPRFAAAGTVYPTGHEPDRCNGTGSGVTVDITDATGRTVTVTPNSVGNFWYQGALTLPFTAAVHYMGRTRTMTTPAASGDCNSCHTQDGTMDAPGRITLP